MTNVEALKVLYVALGNEAADVENANTIVGVLNAIAAKYEGKDDATTNSEGIENITDVLDNIIPEPEPSENNAKFGLRPNSTILTYQNIERLDAPEGCESAGNRGFYNCSFLKYVKLPSTLKSIAASAFSGCSLLETVDIMNTQLTTIEGSSFDGCRSLTSIEIPSTITSIGSNAFDGCTNLATITIHKAEGSITGAPWGAPSTTQIIWNG